jgi:hypothetical protein
VAIGFRSVGTITQVDTSVTGTAPSVGMPLGHVANDLLLMPVFYDDNTGTTTPSGWTLLFTVSAGTSTSSPYAGWAHCKFFYRIDNGSVAGPNLNFSSSAWPAGKPYALAWIAAYSGCDTVTPIGEWNTSNTSSSTAAQAHPQLTTTLANDWLVTLRAPDPAHHHGQRDGGVRLGHGVDRPAPGVRGRYDRGSGRSSVDRLRRPGSQCHHHVRPVGPVLDRRPAHV